MEIDELIERAEALQAQTGQSLSTISRKILNDGKGLARLKAGGQCTLKTLGKAMSALEALEQASGLAQRPTPSGLSALDRLEAEAIHILRETMAGCKNPVLLYSIGKDSSVLVHLARKAFAPAKVPFPLLHVDTGWKFRDMYEVRDRLSRAGDVRLLIYKNPEAGKREISPFTHGAARYTEIMKTQALKQALAKYKFDAAIGGARRDEEVSRAKERIFSLRDAKGRWDPKRQRPELWRAYNTRLGEGESLRVFPLSNWTEMDVWRYIRREHIDVPSLYFAAPRPVIQRDGQWIMVDDERLPLRPGETPVLKSVRFRTLGCYPLTAAVESAAASLDELIAETADTPLSERAGRLIDKDTDEGASMEDKKQDGYF